MDSTCDLIIDSLKEEPIGETDHFIWFITDIGIVALFKKEEKTCVDEKERKETEAMYLDMKGQKLKIVRSKT